MEGRREGKKAGVLYYPCVKVEVSSIFATLTLGS